MKKLDLIYIPEDFYEYWECSDMLYQDNVHFDDAMLKAGFFEYGGTRRSHRIVTKKLKELTIDEAIEVLTGLPHEQIAKIHEQEQLLEDMRELDRITQKYGLQKIKEHLNVQQ
jgi:hypothetical protein